MIRHRPGYFLRLQQRKRHGPPAKLTLGDVMRFSVEHRFDFSNPQAGWLAREFIRQAVWNYVRDHRPPAHDPLPNFDIVVGP